MFASLPSLFASASSHLSCKRFADCFKLIDSHGITACNRGEFPPSVCVDLMAATQ